MPQPDFDALQQELKELALRVDAIEQRVGIAPRVAAAPPGEIAGAPQTDALAATAGAFPLFGRALLGIAGAYLLRALTESGSVPASLGAGLGTLYALAWLAWAARTPAEHKLETTLHSLTSALVLAPLVWEATVRMGALTPWAAALVLLIFIASGLKLSWRKALLIPATITTVTGCGTAAALMVATENVVPFAAVLIGAAALVEAAACFEHWLGERWLTASLADGSVLLATWLVTNPRGLPEGYAPIPAGALLALVGALVAVYLTSTIVRTLLRGFRFTGFETAQCGAALLIAVNAALRMSEAVPALAPGIGVFALACAAACYAVSFLLLERRESGRNFYTYSTFGLLLAIAATWVLLPADALPAAWSLLAAACVWAGRKRNRATLQWHGIIYLAPALVFSTAWTGPLSESARIGVQGFGAAAALCAYVLAGRAEGRNFDAVRTALGGAAVWECAGLVAAVLSSAYHGSLGADAPHAYCAVIRTGTIAAGALALAAGASRWARWEWSRLVIPLMLAGGYRLLMLDAHQGSRTAFAISMVLYGGTLMMLPSLLKRV